MLGALPKIFLRAPVTSLGRHQGGFLWGRGCLLGQKSSDLVRTIFHFTTDHFPLYYGPFFTLLRTRTDSYGQARTDSYGHSFLSKLRTRTDLYGRTRTDSYGLVRTRTDGLVRTRTDGLVRTRTDETPMSLLRTVFHFTTDSYGLVRTAWGDSPRTRTDVGWGRWDARWLTSGVSSALAAGTLGDT